MSLRMALVTVGRDHVLREPDYGLWVQIPSTCIAKATLEAHWTEQDSSAPDCHIFGASIGCRDILLQAAMADQKRQLQTIRNFGMRVIDIPCQRIHPTFRQVPCARQKQSALAARCR